MVTIALTCCILHNFCQFQGMLEPMVHDIQTQGNLMMRFVSMHILMSQEGEGAKIVGEKM